jgi:hypothetical protein
MNPFTEDHPGLVRSFLAVVTTFALYWGAVEYLRAHPETTQAVSHYATQYRSHSGIDR